MIYVIKVCNIESGHSSGKQRRLQFVECVNDVNAMIDSAKVADLVLLLVDGSYGFEMVGKSLIAFDLGINN